MNPSVIDEVFERYSQYGLDRDNVGFYEGWLSQNLVFRACGDCLTLHHPPAPVCPACWSSNLTWRESEGTGEVYLRLILHQGPEADGVSYPYPVVTVEMDDQPGLRFTSSIVGEQRLSVAIGDRVELSWASRDGSWLPVFKPKSTVTS